jgi:eukaryotic-like serine/threonine-protein kinase
VSRIGPGELVSGKYRIVRLIGDGGMGVVYEARHEVLGSSVALKFLHADLAKRPGLTQRFLQEARVSATIQSPHVTHVTDVDTAQDGSPYLVMELLSGQSLQGMLDRQGKLPVDQAVDFALQILAGLEAAHATGVVHRDMKPDNVFVTPTGGGPLLKLIDFGIAKLRASSEFTKGLTRAGVVMGTPEYMAPEQLISAHTTDHRADIYSLGVMLFEMLAGCRPADGDDAEVIVAAVQAGRVRHLPELVPGLPEGLVALIERATLPEREQRFESAAAMRLALAQFAGQLSHAGRLAATAEPMAPLPTPASQALLSLPPHVTNAGVPKTLPPEGPPLSVSQLGAARTSISEGDPVMSQMARPMTGTAMGGGASPYGPPPGVAPAYGYAGAPLAQQPAPVRKKSRSGLLISALVLAVLVGGGAVGYAAYNAADRRVVPPPLPAPDLPTAKPTTEVLTGEGPADVTGTPPNPTVSRPTGGKLPTGTGAGGTGAGGAGSASGGSGQVVVIGNGGATTVQFPFPLPSTLQIPTTIPSTIQLPPGITFPPGFPGVPQQTPTATTTPTAAPTTTPTAAPTTTPTAAPTTTPTTRPRTSARP